MLEMEALVDAYKKLDERPNIHLLNIVKPLGGASMDDKIIELAKKIIDNGGLIEQRIHLYSGGSGERIRQIVFDDNGGKTDFTYENKLLSKKITWKPEYITNYEITSEIIHKFRESVQLDIAQVNYFIMGYWVWNKNRSICVVVAKKISSVGTFHAIKELKNKMFSGEISWDECNISWIEYYGELSGKFNDDTYGMLKETELSEVEKKELHRLQLEEDSYTSQMTAVKEKKVAVVGRDKVRKEAIDPDLQRAIYEIASKLDMNDKEHYMSKLGLKQLGNKVIDLNRLIFASIKNNISNYYITDKLDGERCMVVIESGVIKFISSTLEIITMNGDDKKNPADGKKNPSGGKKLDAIIDGEKYTIGPEEFQYYPFDILRYQGENIYDEYEFSKRLEVLSEVCLAINKSLGHDKFVMKKFIKLNTATYKKQISELKSEPKKYETDGIIFTPDVKGYFKMKIYKYKPREKLTIDFLIKKCPKSLIGIKPYIKKLDSNGLYILFVGIQKHCCRKLKLEPLRGYSDIFKDNQSISDIPKMLGVHYKFKNVPEYFPIQFETSDRMAINYFESSDQNLDGEVGEFSWIDGSGWHLHRIREDRRVEISRGRYFGNNYSIAEITWMNIKFPLMIEDEGDGGDDVKEDDEGDGSGDDEGGNGRGDEDNEDEAGYFKTHRSQKHKAARQYNSFIKYKMFADFDKEEKNYWVMDMASGKGQDFFKYIKSGISNLLCVERDINGLIEIINKKHSMCSNQHIRQSMRLVISHMDLNDMATQNLERLRLIGMPPSDKGFKYIMCNFAFHYFVYSADRVKQLAGFINELLAPGGRFIMSTFDGKRVYNLLENSGGVWKSREVGKYEIRKAYNGKFAGFGQEIKLLLPFSDGKFYAEWLVNIEEIAKIFSKKGIEYEYELPFGDHINDYPLKDTLDDDDKVFVSLYSYYSFYKKIKGSKG
jgi:hypothetical protein